MEPKRSKCGDVIDSPQLKRHQAGRACYIGAMCWRAKRDGFHHVKSEWIFPMRKNLHERFCRKAPYRIYRGSIVYTHWFKSPRLGFQIEDLMNAAVRLCQSKGIRTYKAFGEILTLTDREVWSYLDLSRPSP